MKENWETGRGGKLGRECSSFRAAWLMAMNNAAVK